MQKIRSLQGMRFCLFITIFLFHLSDIGTIGDSQIYFHILQGGGMLAVSYFFVLSGFVASLSESGKEVVSFKSYVQFIIKRFSKIYPYHLFFLIAVLPLYYRRFLHAPLKNLCVLICNLFLMQSWSENRAVWLSYNGVSWFCSTLLFLTACSPWLYKLFHKKMSRYMTPVFLLSGIILLWSLMLYAAESCPDNDSYWLYAFPPMRLLDYIAGYFLCEIYKETKSERKRERKWIKTVLDILVVVIYATYLLIFPYLDIYIRRAAVYLPGALFTLWVLVNNNGWLERILSGKKISELGGKTLCYMMCHQVILKYINKIIAIVGKEDTWIGLGGGIAALLLTLLSEHVLTKIIMGEE